MTDYKTLIEELRQAALHPGKAVAASMSKTGKEAVGCFPIYTPEEIVYAAGYLPVGMWGGRTELKLADKYLQSFCCSIMRSNMEYGMRGTYNRLSAVLIPTFCDTLKCICENWKVAVPQIPVIPVVYPQNRGLEAGRAYLQAELERVKTEQETLSGRAVTEGQLEEALAVYEDYRQAMRAFTAVAASRTDEIDALTRHLIIKAGWFIDKKEYTYKIREITAGLEKTGQAEEAGKIRIVATGLLAEPAEVLTILSENGIVVVGDDLAQESRQFRIPARKTGSVWERMACRFADQKGCTFCYEMEKTRGQLLIDMVREQKASGVIVFMMKFCDPEEFDYPVYTEELVDAGIPFLYLELDQQLDSFEQIRTRIQSFVEMLQ